MNWEPKIKIEEGGNLIRKINDWKEAPVWTPDKIKVATKEWFDLLKKMKIK